MTDKTHPASVDVDALALALARANDYRQCGGFTAYSLLLEAIKALAAAARQAPAPQPATSGVPVGRQWRKRFPGSSGMGSAYDWSEWEALQPPYMDARELAKTDPENYEVRALGVIAATTPAAQPLQAAGVDAKKWPWREAYGDDTLPAPEQAAHLVAERQAFERAHKEAGYGSVKWNSDGDRPMYSRDHDRYVGWQIARANLAAPIASSAR